jgi:hypothetical protein
VNGKNRFGGYVGYNKFYAWGGDGGIPLYTGVKSDSSTEVDFTRCYKHLTSSGLRSMTLDAYQALCRPVDVDFWLRWKQFCEDKPGQTEF